MLFNDILKEKYDQLAPVFDKLFDLAIKHQTHSGDLLLIMENAHLTEEPDPDENDKVKLFYNIGPTMDHHCETANHDFIKQYTAPAMPPMILLTNFFIRNLWLW